jgi:hypothetical protein
MLMGVTRKKKTINLNSQKRIIINQSLLALLLILSVQPVFAMRCPDGPYLGGGA